MANTDNSNILIVDEDPSTIKVLTTLLKGQGFEVGVAKDGDEAMEYMKEKKYDLIITDFKMPDIDGYKLLDIVKAFYREYKVMVMTEDEAKKEWLMQRGLLKSFKKPMDLQSFLNELSMFIKERRKTKRFKVEKQLECSIKDLKSNTTYEAELLDVSIDGILLEVTGQMETHRPVELEFTLSRDSKIIFKLSGRVVRIPQSTETTCQVGVYFDDSRELTILEQLRPFIEIKSDA